MMIEVKKVDVAILLSEHVEECIEPIGKLGHPVPPAESQFLSESIGLVILW